MEDVLDLYQCPNDPRHPLVNMDEKPVQLIQETRTPWPAKPGKPQRDDDEYERVGTANVFLFTAPLTGWRTIDISAHAPRSTGPTRSSTYLMTVILRPTR